jgi:hypothetical protein
MHSVDPECLAPDEEGWWFAKCSCGWAPGKGAGAGRKGVPFPGIEEVVDSLMEHAAVMALMTARKRGSAG